MKRIISQVIKEIAQFRRDKLTVALAFLLPLGMLLIYGFAIRLEAKNIPVSVQDFDNTPLSRAYIERLFNTNQFIPAVDLDRGVATASIDHSVAKATVIIPPQFSRHIKSGESVDVQVLIDGTDVNNARIIQNAIKATTVFFLRTNKLQENEQKVTAHVRLWFNPGRKESLYIVPGIYAVVLWVFPSMLTGIAMVREKEQGTIIQVYASNLTAREWLLGKGIAYFLIAICQTIFVMTIGSILFQISLVSEPSSFLIGTLLFLAAAVSFGLFVGAGAPNQTAAVQGTAILGFLTAFLLSGFIYPLSNIPFPISLLSNLIPARYYLLVTRDAFVRGTGWAGIWFAPLFIGVIAFLFFNGAVKKLNRMQLSD